ncbi:MAG: hypothetical protein ACFBWO_08365 [Paracoccaceae bacterium]
MIFTVARQANNAAVHAAGGFAFGVLGVLAACTLAQVAARGMREAQSMRVGGTGPAQAYTPPGTTPPSGAP